MHLVLVIQNKKHNSQNRSLSYSDVVNKQLKADTRKEVKFCDLFSLFHVFVCACLTSISSHFNVPCFCEPSGWVAVSRYGRRVSVDKCNSGPVAIAARATTTMGADFYTYYNYHLAIGFTRTQLYLFGEF